MAERMRDIRRTTQLQQTCSGSGGDPEGEKRGMERGIDRRKVDSGDESGLRGRVISPFGRMSQQVFFVNPHKTLLHSKEISAITVLACFSQREPGTFCRTQRSAAGRAARVASFLMNNTPAHENRDHEIVVIPVVCVSDTHRVFSTVLP